MEWKWASFSILSSCRQHLLQCWNAEKAHWFVFLAFRFILLCLNSFVLSSFSAQMFNQTNNGVSLADFLTFTHSFSSNNNCSVERNKLLTRPEIEWRLMRRRFQESDWVEELTPFVMGANNICEVKIFHSLTPFEGSETSPSQHLAVVKEIFTKTTIHPNNSYIFSHQVKHENTPSDIHCIFPVLDETRSPPLRFTGQYSFLSVLLSQPPYLLSFFHIFVHTIQARFETRKKEVKNKIFAIASLEIDKLSNCFGPNLQLNLLVKYELSFILSLILSLLGD